MRTAAVRTAVLLTLVSALPALAGDDALLRSGDSVLASLASGERETISFAGVAGTPLDLRVAAPRGSRVVPRLTLLDPDGALAPAADPNPDAGRVARIDGFVLPKTGVWRIVLDSPTPGAFELSSRAAPPVRLEWNGAGPSAEWQFDAAPGGRASVELTAADGASLELYGPAGDRLAHAETRSGRAVIRHARLPDLGQYLVRAVGTTGEISARAVIRPAAPQIRPLRTVESRPDVRAFAPGSANNQSLFTLDLDGIALNNRQTVVVVRDGDVVASADVRTTPAAGATALFDLTDVAPGTYSLEIRRHGRPATAVPGEFAVTNLAPHIETTAAATAPNTGDFPLRVVGYGFDDDAEVLVRPVAGGESLPVTVTRRKGHESIDVLVAPPPFFAGACDLEVRDPDGASGVLASGIELLGYRAAPAAVLTVTDTTPAALSLANAAHDDSRGRVLAAFLRGPGAASFVLFDAASLAPLDTLDVAAADLGGGEFDELQATYDAVGDTFALCLTTSASPTRAFVRIVSASDIHTTVAEQDLASATAQAVSRVHAAPNRDDGGYLVVWDEFEHDFGSRIWSRKVDVEGAFAAGAPPLVVWNPYGEIGQPTVAYQKDGAFIVAWAGLSEDRFGYAVAVAMTDASGAPLPGTAPRTVATSRKWDSSARPSLAVNPATGATLLTWWYGDGPIFRPGARGLAAGTGAPLVTALLDEALDFEGGVPGGAVWNAERGEFVVTTVGYDSRAAVWRLLEDGTLRSAARVELYECTAAVPYGGASPGSLGLLRVADADDDGVFDKKTTTLRVLAGPLR